MSANAWLLWFTAQSIAFVGVLVVAMLGVTGRLSRTRRPRPTTHEVPRPSHHLHLTFRHRPAR